MAILKKICIFILPLLLLTGCYEDFTPTIDTKPVLCINSLITAGEPIELSLTHTWLYTDMKDINENHDVDDATVIIYANGEEVDKDYLPKEGDAIRIVAESKTYGKAEAEVTVPVSVPISSVKWNAEITDRWASVHPESESYMLYLDLNAKMTINSPSKLLNYYRFSYNPYIDLDNDNYPEDAFINPPFYITSGNLSYDSEPIFSEHISSFELVTGSDAFGFTFFTDRQFSGKSYTLNLKFSDIEFDARNLSVSLDKLDCGLELKLYTVSQSYYNWCVYEWNVWNGSIEDLGELGLADPVWGYSNVSTGAGVVAAQSSSSYFINLKDFLKDEIISLRDQLSQQYQ